MPSIMVSDGEGDGGGESELDEGGREGRETRLVSCWESGYKGRGSQKQNGGQAC